MMFLKWLDRHFEHTVLAVLLVVLTVLSFMNVVMRYGFQSGLSWSDEVCKYSLVLSGFFSMPCWKRYPCRCSDGDAAGEDKAVFCISDRPADDRVFVFPDKRGG